VPESNRRRLDHSQASSPLDEHPHEWLRRKESNLRTPVPKTGVYTNINYSASAGAAARAQTSNHAFRRRPRCSLAPRRRMVHPAGLEPAHTPGLSRLPLPIGLRMHWSGRRALLPPPPAWRAGALLNELLPVIGMTAIASSAGGLEGPGARWVTLQNPLFPADCGGGAPTTSGKTEILGRLRLPKPLHHVSPLI
jgi:hypothetical protein